MAGAVVALLAAGLLVDYLVRSGGNDDAPPAADGNSGKVARPNPADVPLPKLTEGRLLVFTRPEPGFVVLVDGEPVRTGTGDRLTTPCELVLDAARSHRVTVAKPGFRDETRYLAPSTEEPTEVVYDPVPDPADVSTSQLDAEWLSAKVGEPISLGALNTPGEEADPFVTPDGLSLYHVANGPGGAGIRVAVRETPFTPFAESEMVPTTSGYDVPASPSEVSIGAADSEDLVTHLVYAVPKKSRVTAVTRRNALRGFDETTAFRYDTKRAVPWIAAQMVADGLALYWTTLEKDRSVAYFSARESVGDDFESTLRVPLPGGLPRLSHDGLRQYVYDGRVLKRARRAKVFDWRTEKVRGRDVTKPVHLPFSDLETVAEIVIEDYRPSDRHRQFCVSRDEQWMFYVADPAAGGDLFAVRLHDGPAWGLRPRGTTIENRDFTPPSPAVAAAEPDPAETPFEPPAAAAPDPRDETLHYTAHREEFTRLLAERRHDEALALATQRLGDPAFESSRTLVEWDRDDAQRVRDFWQAVDEGAASLVEGDTFKNRTITLEFVRHENGVLYGERDGEQYDFRVAEMPHANVTALAERAVEETDAEGQLAIAAFLHHEPGTVPRATEARLAAAGELGERFVEHLAERMLKQAELEFDREAYRKGLAWLARLREEHPESAAAERSNTVEAELYTRMKWRKVGPRQWTGSETGAWAAGPERAEDSWLQSEKPYENFEMQMEYRTTTDDGSGGVFFRYAGEPRRPPYRVNAAFKIQLADDFGVPPDAFCTGALFGVEAPARNAAGKRGEWNAFRIRVEGQKVRVWINEQPVLDATAVNEGIPPGGYIALDGITGGITYRHVLLLELPPTN